MLKNIVVGVSAIVLCSAVIANATIGENYFSDTLPRRRLDEIKYSVDIEPVNVDYLKIQLHYDKYDGPLSYDFLAYIDSVIKEEGMEDKVSLAFMVALIDVESQFSHHRESSAGAYGLCQIMPRTAKSVNKMFGRELDRKNEYDNVRLSILYFKDLYNRYKYTENVVRFYNGGVKWHSKPATKKYYNKIIKKTVAIKEAIRN